MPLILPLLRVYQFRERERIGPWNCSQSPAPPAHEFVIELLGLQSPEQSYEVVVHPLELRDANRSVHVIEVEDARRVHPADIGLCCV